MDPVTVGDTPPSTPSSDLQFVAQMLLLTRQGQQITSVDAERLETIASQGYSSPLPSGGVRAVTPFGGSGQI